MVCPQRRLISGRIRLDCQFFPVNRARNIRRHPHGIRAWARMLWDALESTPHLTLIASLGGVLCILLIASRMAADYGGPGSYYRHSALAESDAEVRVFTYEFGSVLMRCGALLLAPALLLSLVRNRGLDRLLPITLASVAVTIFWLRSDLFENFTLLAISNLGEEPSLPAYYCKLVVIGATLLCPPLIMWLYQRSTLLDKYVLKTFLVPFCICFFGLIALFIIFDLRDNARDFIEANFSGRQIARFYLIQIPKLVVEVIDISLLLAVLYSLSRMSRYKEIISMLGAGRSVGRILLPLFCVGFYSTLVMMACNYQWAPEADRKKSDMLRLAEEADPQRKARKAKAGGERVAYMNRADRRFWFLNEVPIDLSENNKIDQIEIHQHDEQGRLIWSLYAKNAIWQGRTPPVWIFYNVREMTYPNSEDISPGISYDHRLPRLPKEGWAETPWRLLSESAKLPAQFLSVPQLASYLKTNREFPEGRLASYRTWWHDRLARPLRCVVVILFAAPLGIVYSRRGLMGSVASSVILYVAMYFLTSIFIRMGETSKLPAMMAAWSVNILFGGVGALLLWQRSKNREFAQLLAAMKFWKKA
jgi:LPS export ABC transporter permease LptG